MFFYAHENAAFYVFVRLDNFKVLCFFFRRKFYTHKKHKNHKDANKRTSVMLIKMLPFLFLFIYMRFVLFVRVKSFVKKKKKVKTAPMTSFILLLSSNNLSNFSPNFSLKIINLSAHENSALPI